MERFFNFAGPVMLGETLPPEVTEDIPLDGKTVHLVVDGQ